MASECEEKNRITYDDQIMTVGIKSGEWIIHKDMFGMKSKRVFKVI